MRQIRAAILSGEGAGECRSKLPWSFERQLWTSELFGKKASALPLPAHLKQKTAPEELFLLLKSITANLFLFY